MQANWTVIVGNVGTVYDGTDEQEARFLYADWCALSTGGIGRASGEPVTLFKDGVIVLERAGEGYGDVVDEELDLTDSLCFTRRQQDILGAALNQIAAMGLFPAAEVEELAEQISNA